MKDEILPEGLEPLLSAMAQRFAADREEREVEVLTTAKAALLLVGNHPHVGELFCLSLLLPARLYERLAAAQQRIERDLLSCARGLLPRPLARRLASVSLGPQLQAERYWRQRLRERRSPRPGPEPVPLLPLREPPPPWRSVEVRLIERVGPREPKELRYLEEEQKIAQGEKKARRRYRYVRIS